jgi:hypothetical protein
MKAFHYYLTVIFFCLLSVQLNSQSRSEPMFWLQVSEKVQFTPTFSGLALLQKRYFLDKHDTYQDLFWASGAIHLKHVKVGGGFMYVSTHKHLTDTYKAIPEYRPFQYVSYAGSLPETRWRYQIRAMVEERLLSKVMEDEIITIKNFRIRYRLRSNLMFDFARNAQIRLSNEWLWTHNAGITQNRAFAELAYHFRGWRVAAGYMNWWIKGIEKPWRHVWLMRIDHRVNWQQLAHNLKVFDNLRPQSMID